MNNYLEDEASASVLPRVTLPKTNMTLENPPLEDVFPIENSICFSNVMLFFRGTVVTTNEIILRTSRWKVSDDRSFLYI